MIDIKLLKENPNKIKKSSEDKGIKIDVSHILEIEKKANELSQTAQKLREERNKNTSEIKGKPTDAQIKKGKDLKDKLEKEESALRAVEEELNTWLSKIPNPAKDDVKVGKNEEDNEVLRKEGNLPKFDFKSKDHLDLGEKLGLIDVKSASKVSGARLHI